ncbi:MAG: hypothetical protein ACXV8P_03365 [Methylobacter sp.]
MSDSWLLEFAFNLVLENQLCVKRKTPDISLLANLIPHYGEQLGSFQVPRDAPPEVLNNIKLSASSSMKWRNFILIALGRIAL